MQGKTPDFSRRVFSKKDLHFSSAGCIIVWKHGGVSPFIKKIIKERPSMKSNVELIGIVLKQFCIPFDAFQVETFHSGHINSTFKVETRYQGKRDAFVAQRINTYVFQDPVGIMQNIDLVTTHITERLVAEGIDPAGKVLNFLKRKDGTNYFFEDLNNFWRVYRFIPDSVTYDKAEDRDILKSAGRAFGGFQEQLSDLPMDLLKDTMPNFHNTPWRMKNCFEAAEKDVCGRRSEVEKELAILRENEEIWSRLEKEKEAGRIPLRVTHNDTKYNNVLIDQNTGEAICVIDLDTVNPGLCAYDFGDAIRFCANSAAEDEPDVEKVSLDLGLYEAFASGFIPACAAFCDKRELDSLLYGPITMTFELVARFLEDYLKGDKYFKIAYPEHNLVRARSQLKLALDMKQKMNRMGEINASLTGNA